MPYGSGGVSAEMSDEGDRYLRLVGIGLVAALVVMSAIAVVIAVNVPENRVSPPDAEWSFEQVNATHTRITHDGGEAIPASSLIVTVDGYERHASWSGPIEAGDGATVRAARGQLVRVYWDGGHTDRFQLARRSNAPPDPTTA